jgi:hypothetical protein
MSSEPMSSTSVPEPPRAARPPLCRLEEIRPGDAVRAPIEAVAASAVAASPAGEGAPAEGVGGGAAIARRAVVGTEAGAVAGGASDVRVEEAPRVSTDTSAMLPRPRSAMVIPPMTSGRRTGAPPMSLGSLLPLLA